MHSRRATRRRHPAELKDKVLAACEQPGTSVAEVAQAHGLNANLVHKWRRLRDARRSPSTAIVTPAKAAEVSVPLAWAGAATAVTTQRPVATRTLADAASASAFVALQLEKPSSAPADIRLELRRGTATVIVNWPIQDAAACGTWLREWLR
jgi:transposase